MLFGLANARSTYQRLVNEIFEDQISKTIEVYVKDMLAKRKTTTNHIKDLG